MSAGSDDKAPGEVAGIEILSQFSKHKPDEGLIRFLLERESPLLTLVDQDGKTALMHLSTGSNIALMKDFIAGGAQVNQKQKLANGNSALHMAASSGHDETVRLFVANGGNVADRNDDGQTPLDLARGRVGPTLLAELEKKFAEQDPATIKRREISDYISEQGLRTAETVEAPRRAAFRPRMR